MFECQICGLLSLGGSSCPACGSQLRTDLTEISPDDEILLTDVPGLDEAAEAWYDLEGIEPPQDGEISSGETSDEPSLGALTFTLHDYRLGLVPTQRAYRLTVRGGPTST